MCLCSALSRCFIQVSSAVSTHDGYLESDNSGSLEEVVICDLVQSIPDVLTNSKQDPSQLISVKLVNTRTGTQRLSRTDFFKWIYGPRTLNKICCTQEALKRWFCKPNENCQSKYRGERIQDLLMVQTFNVNGPMNTSVTNSYPVWAKLFDFNSSRTKTNSLHSRSCQ